MTERCHTKFTEKLNNQNNIIYLGIFVGSLAAFYFYRFHFATIAFSYVLGCVACYYGLNSRILHYYVDHLKCHFIQDLSNEEPKDEPVKGCETCGSKDCSRHDYSVPTEPWDGLQIHKQLDQAIEDFYNAIIDQFINSWYSKVTVEPFFVDELRHQLRYASSCLLRRAVKINYSQLITSRLVPCALQHYARCAAGAGAGAGGAGAAHAHAAVASRGAELRYLRALSAALAPHLLRPSEADNPVVSVLIREIFAGWVLLSLTDVLADPYILNTLIVLATGDETMAQLPATPDYKVEFLETFVRQTDALYARRGRRLRVRLEPLLGDQDHFYAFMQHLKATGHVHLLQFYKDIKSFQTRILNPDLQPDELVSLHAAALDLYERYCTGSVPAELRPLADELRALRAGGRDSVKRLQNSGALYQAARHSQAELEKIMLPKFLHSEEFYKLFIGSRIPTGYQKQLTKKQQDNLLHTTAKIGSRLKGTVKQENLDGHILDSGADVSDVDSGDNIDILKYLDSIASEDLKEQNLSMYKVVLTNVEARLQAPPRRGSVRVFTCAVHRSDAAGARLWTLRRSEHDFHLLRSKLHEFHGDRLLHDLPLPSRRDNSPMETLRYKYEDFLQRLLQKSLLQTSELLHLFLTVDSDFSLVVQASTLNANSTDLANIYQSVTHKLRKEKGQHLESFLRNLLVSSDIERYQALKQGTSQVEEGVEVGEEAPQQVKRRQGGRDIHNSVFGDNFGVPLDLSERSAQCHSIGGTSQCLVFLLTRIIKAHRVVSNIVGGLLSITKDVVDDLSNRYLNRTLCNVLSERRLAHLIRLGHGVLFGKGGSSPRAPPGRQRELARRRLARRVPAGLPLALGAGLPLAVHTAFEIIQRPQLNKQLVYNLLDLCILELFPELSATENKSKEPKS